MITLKVDPSKCDRCGKCLVACTLARDPVKSGKFNIPLTSLLWIENINNNMQIDLCRHCEMPVCMDACVATAINIDSCSGTVTVDKDRCIGCWSCVMECPFRALRLPEGYAVKCDGCKELEKPLCAGFCPTGALKSSIDSRGTAVKQRRDRAQYLGKAIKLL